MSGSKKLWLSLLTVVLALGSVLQAADQKKVLYIDSYHEGYPWSDGITKGIKSVIGDKAELKVFRMDTKNHATEEDKVKAADEAKKVIEDWKPDVVIASDDNASKYLIKAFYMDKDLPFVFCGVNWDASVYGFPTKNVCGMEEVALVLPLMEQMKKFAKGDRIGFLSVDNETGHKEGDNIKKKFSLALVEKYPATFEQWKADFKELQANTDMIIVENVAGLKDYDEAAAKAFVLEETKVPTGAILDFVAPLTLIGFAKSAEEQGEWAAAAALRILGGESPEKVGVTQNKKGTLYVNLPLAQKMGVTIPLAMLKNATVIK